ncbi:MAG: efflux RND transporter periplasmic adaptor subunit [Anaeromyxobacter sp.]
MNRTALAVPLSILVAACGADPKAGQKGPRPVAVRAAPAQARDVPVEVRAVGRIEASQSVAVRPQVSGQITRMHFTEGQYVQKDALLVEIDRRPYEAALAEARGRLAQDQARAENARADATRFAELVGKEYVSRSQYEAAKANAAALEAAVVADRATVERAALNLSYCTIRAPASGRTGRLLVHPGNLVSANAAEPLLTLQQVKPVFATFSIPEGHLPALRARREAPPPVRVRAGNGPEVRGELVFVDNAVDATTGTILLRARIENADELLWPGQAVDVFVRVAERQRAVVVPASAVATGQQGDYAYVVVDGKAQLRSVTVAEAKEKEAVLASGIAAGETVVTEGLLKLRPDAPVELLGSGAPARAEGAGTR